MSLSPSLLYAAFIHRQILEQERHNETLLSSSLSKSDKQLIGIKTEKSTVYIPINNLKNVTVYNVYSTDNNKI